MEDQAYFEVDPTGRKGGFFSKEKRQSRKANRQKTKTARRAKRQTKRSGQAKDGKFVGTVVNKARSLIKGGGDASVFDGGMVIMEKGITPVLIRQGAVSIIIMGPGSAVDEAVARIENPDLPAEDPMETSGEYAEVLVARGDLTAGHAALSGCAVAMAASDGCHHPEKYGQTMAGAANFIEQTIGALHSVGGLPSAIPGVGAGGKVAAIKMILGKLKGGKVIETFKGADGAVIERVKTLGGKVFDVVKSGDGNIMDAFPTRKKGESPSPDRTEVHNHYYSQPPNTGASHVPQAGKEAWRQGQPSSCCATEAWSGS